MAGRSGAPAPFWNELFSPNCYLSKSMNIIKETNLLQCQLLIKQCCSIKLGKRSLPIALLQDIISLIRRSHDLVTGQCRNIKTSCVPALQMPQNSSQEIACAKSPWTFYLWPHFRGHSKTALSLYAGTLINCKFDYLNYLPNLKASTFFLSLMVSTETMHH